jgi:hypothetical protein
MSQKYRGGCQCGAVSYEVHLDLGTPITCNCSRCQPLGLALSFAPRHAFVLQSGDDNLTEYRFNTKQIQHLFCKTCGVESFAYGALPDGSPTVAINVNCLEGVDPRALECRHVDGRGA